MKLLSNIQYFKIVYLCVFTVFSCHLLLFIEMIKQLLKSIDELFDTLRDLKYVIIILIVFYSTLILHNTIS